MKEIKQVASATSFESIEMLMADKVVSKYDKSLL